MNVCLFSIVFSQLSSSLFLVTSPFTFLFSHLMASLPVSARLFLALFISSVSSQKYEFSSMSHSSGFSFHRQTQLQTALYLSCHKLWHVTDSLPAVCVCVCVSYRHFYLSDRPILTHPACGDRSYANSSLSLTLKPKSRTYKYPRTNTSFTLKLECNLTLHIGYI